MNPVDLEEFEKWQHQRAAAEAQSPQPVPLPGGLPPPIRQGYTRSVNQWHGVAPHAAMAPAPGQGPLQMTDSQLREQQDLLRHLLEKKQQADRDRLNRELQSQWQHPPQSPSRAAPPQTPFQPIPGQVPFAQQPPRPSPHSQNWQPQPARSPSLTHQALREQTRQVGNKLSENKKICDDTMNAVQMAHTHATHAKDYAQLAQTKHYAIERASSHMSAQQKEIQESLAKLEAAYGTQGLHDNWLNFQRNSVGKVDLDSSNAQLLKSMWVDYYKTACQNQGRENVNSKDVRAAMAIHVWNCVEKFATPSPSPSPPPQPAQPARPSQPPQPPTSPHLAARTSHQEGTPKSRNKGDGKAPPPDKVRPGAQSSSARASPQPTPIPPAAAPGPSSPSTTATRPPLTATGSTPTPNVHPSTAGSDPSAKSKGKRRRPARESASRSGSERPVPKGNKAARNDD